MTMNALSKRALALKLQMINSLDFSMLKMKLMDPQEGKGWTQKECDDAEILYKNFLYLILKYPKESIVPTRFIDDFWHAHILDTRQYHKNCQNIFGGYLHHYPYFGLQGEEDAKDLKNTFAQTQILWQKEFGTIISQAHSICETDSGQAWGNGNNDEEEKSKKIQSSLCNAGGNCVSTCESTGGNCVSSCKEERPIKRGKNLLTAVSSRCGNSNCGSRCSHCRTVKK